MPNYCESKIGFICDEKHIDQLKILQGKLYDICFMENQAKKAGYGNGWLGCVAIKHGLDYDTLPCDGKILDVDDLDEDVTHFKISVQTLWKVEIDLWDAVIKQYAGIRYVYISEDTCGGVYINTDSEGVCFPEKYVIYANMAGSSYKTLPPDYFTGTITPMELFDEKTTFKNFKELQEFMTEITGKTFETVNCMNLYFQDAMRAYDRDNDGLDDSIVEIYEYAYTADENKPKHENQ